MILSCNIIKQECTLQDFLASGIYRHYMTLFSGKPCYTDLNMEADELVSLHKDLIRERRRHELGRLS